MRTAKIILKNLFLLVVALGWGQTAWGNESKTVTYTIKAKTEGTVTTLTFTPSGVTFGGGLGAKTVTFASTGFSIELHDGITFTCKSGTFALDGNNIYGSGTVKYEITSTGYFFSSEARNNDGDVVAFSTSRAQSFSSTISDEKKIGQIQLTLDDYWGTNDGKSEAKAFEISDATGLNYLSSHVNSGADFSGYYFKLTSNIAFSHTTDWDNASSYENNFARIGDHGNYPSYPYYPFAGTFDGQNHVISGIRIYDDDGNNIGLFGYLNGGTVKNVILSDTRITACDNVGGIVGIMREGSTVQNCNVTSTVAIHTADSGNDGANYHGGIVGHVYGGTVSNCTSAAIFTFNGGKVGSYYGGIAGFAEEDYNLTNCLALGVNIPYDNTIPDYTTGASYRGAVVGAYFFGTIKNNYYSACYVGGKTSDIGTTGSDITTNDGAVPALRHNADNTTALGLLNAIHVNYGNYNVSIADRTLYKDNYWNTLCLPFSLTSFTGTPLAGAIVKELDTSGTYNGHKTGVDGSTLYLNFKEATSIVAGKPYFVKYTSGSNTVEPVFSGIRVSNTTPTGITSQDGNVTFIGRYTNKSYTSDDPSVLLMGRESKLYYPFSGASIGAFLAYFQLNNDITAGDQPSSIKSFVHNLDDYDFTGIIAMPAADTSLSTTTSSWFTLDGRRLDKQPTQPGLYIVGGRKVVIK